MFHIYCGNGKGKTTASIGLAVRYFGAGGKVYFYQFMKNGTSSEVNILKNMGIYVKACTPCNKFTFKMNDEEKNAVREYHNQMLSEISDIKEKSLIILDEIFRRIIRILLTVRKPKKLYFRFQMIMKLSSRDDSHQKYF